jgi:hypothetical protein
MAQFRQDTRGAHPRSPSRLLWIALQEYSPLIKGKLAQTR